MSTHEDLIHEGREMSARGFSEVDIIRHLAKSGLTITESIKVLMEISDITLAEAKRRVAKHPVWQVTAKNADVVHQELEEVLKKEILNGNG